MTFSKLGQVLKSHPKKDPVNPFAFDNPQAAAVLVLVNGIFGNENILLTRRTETVEHHKGQICFPGGVADLWDESLWMTALRETEEETGITPNCVGYLGELGNIFTPSGFKIHPFVGFAQKEYILRPSDDEIAEIFTVPLSHLLDDLNHRKVTRNYSGQEYEDTVYTCQNHEIWGATGRIITEFLAVWQKAGR